jgi:hypothetical protein
MRISPPSPRVKWKVVAIDDRDAQEFAKKLETVLQQLVDSGFNIVSQMARGEALVITATRMEEDPAPANRRRPVTMSKPMSPVGQGTTTEEVVYNYMRLSPGPRLQCSERFPSLLEALRCVRKHGRAYVDGDVLPVSIVTVAATVFEPLTFPSLMRLFSTDLDTPPSKMSE